MRRGYAAEARGGAIDVGPGVDLVLVAGGAEGSRRDGFGAVVDAVTSARKVAGAAAAVVACVPRAEEGDAIEASLASGADDVVVCPPTAGRAAWRGCAPASSSRRRGWRWSASSATAARSATSPAPSG